MEVYIGKTSGFCLGVKIAIDKAKAATAEKKKIYCLGEIVHNKQVVKSLEDNGMITIDNIEEVPDGEIVIFRAHGEAKKIYERAKEKNLQIIDTTCGKVKAIHEKVEREKESSFIIIIGKKNHPEIIGTKGFAGDNSFIIENEDDILDAYIEYEKTNLGKVFVVAQTTFSSKLFDEIVEQVQTNFIEADVIVDKTICDATEIRQAETSKMSKEFHYMFVIGGKNSSNTKELVKIAQTNCENVYNIETVEEIKNLKFDANEKAGIIAGASTPQESICNVKEYLEKVTND